MSFCNSKFLSLEYYSKNSHRIIPFVGIAIMCVILICNAFSDKMTRERFAIVEISFKGHPRAK